MWLILAYEAGKALHLLDRKEMAYRGNFLSILEAFADRDSILKQHLDTCKKMLYLLCTVHLFFLDILLFSYLIKVATFFPACFGH